MRNKRDRPTAAVVMPENTKVEGIDEEVGEHPGLAHVGQDVGPRTLRGDPQGRTLGPSGLLSPPPLTLRADTHPPQGRGNPYNWWTP